MADQHEDLGQLTRTPLDFGQASDSDEPRLIQLAYVLRGEIEHKDFWLLDLDTGVERQLTNFGRRFSVRDFDVSPDGREIVFDHVQENSDIVLIDGVRAR